MTSFQKVKHYARRLKELSVGEIFDRVSTRVLRRARYLGWRTRDSVIASYHSPSDQLVLSRIITQSPSSPAPNARSLARHAELESHQLRILSDDPLDFASAAGLPRINRANRKYSRYVVSLIDSGYTHPAWDIDPKSGYRWPAEQWSPTIKYGDTHGIDVKYPWDMARGYHLVEMATQPQGPLDESAASYRNLVLSFIAANPPRRGVNWTCTMDVAIRITNWLIAYDLFRAAGHDFGKAFDNVLARSAFDHGLHIIRFLEWNDTLRGNHYLANLCGLIFIASFLPADEQSNAWLKFALSEFRAELPEQFHQDGSNFEASTSYHRLSLEMVAITAGLLRGVPEARLLDCAAASLENLTPLLPPALQSSLAQAESVTYTAEFSELDQVLVAGYEFLLDTTGPDDASIQIGDNDSGRFVRARYAYQESSLRENLLDYDELRGNLEFLLGREIHAGTQLICRTLSNNTPASHRIDLGQDRSFARYDDFGLFIWRKADMYLAIRCGSVGQRGFGGHAHNDQLSFVTWFRNKPFFIDPGSPTYTADHKKRNLYRSNKMHNTLAVDEEEQNRWQEGQLGLFSLIETCRSEIDEASPNAFDGRIIYPAGVSHRRRLEIAETNIHVEDSYLGQNASASFVLHPDVLCTRLVGRNGFSLKNGDIEVSLIAEFGTPSISEVEVAQGYGCVQKSQLITWNTLPTNWAWHIDF